MASTPPPPKVVEHAPDGEHTAAPNLTFGATEHIWQQKAATEHSKTEFNGTIWRAAEQFWRNGALWRNGTLCNGTNFKNKSPIFKNISTNSKNESTFHDSKSVKNHENHEFLNVLILKCGIVSKNNGFDSKITFFDSIYFSSF